MTTVTINLTTGDVSNIARKGGHAFDLQGFSTMDGGPGAAWEVAVEAVYPAVMVTRTLPGRVRLTETFSPGDTGSVQWSLSVIGLNASTFTAPISTAVLFDPATSQTDLTWWSPWDWSSYSRSAPWIDPLKPSDGRFGFWAGSYNYGWVYSGGVVETWACVCPSSCSSQPRAAHHTHHTPQRCSSQ